MDYGQSFSFVWKDPDWIKKVAIASVIVLVGFITLGLALIPLAGWMVAITRHVIRGEEPALAEWSDVGTLIIDGLKVIVVAIVWAIPLMLVIGCFSTLAAVAANQDQGATLSSIAGILNACVSFPYGIIVGILLPASIGEIADHGQLGQALNPANAFKLVRANLGGYIIVWLLAGIASSILSTVGILICVIGVFPAIAYASALTGHLYGQAYKVAQSAA
jgi:hypothetical protein